MKKSLFKKFCVVAASVLCVTALAIVPAGCSRRCKSCSQAKSCAAGCTKECCKQGKACPADCTKACCKKT